MEPEEIEIIEPSNAELLARIETLEGQVRLLSEQSSAQKIMAASPAGTVIYTISKEDSE